MVRHSKERLVIVLNGGWCVAALLGVALVVGFNGWMWWRERGQK